MAGPPGDRRGAVVVEAGALGPRGALGGRVVGTQVARGALGGRVVGTQVARGGRVLRLPGAPLKRGRHQVTGGQVVGWGLPLVLGLAPPGLELAPW